MIEPANPQVVYVPAYDPWLVYGAPIVAYPGWYPVPGIFWGGVGLSFGLGFGIGFFGGFGWGWGHWGYDWGGRRAFFDHHEFRSHSRDFGHDGFHHGDFAHGNFGHGGNVGHGGKFGQCGKFGPRREARPRRLQPAGGPARVFVFVARSRECPRRGDRPVQQGSG